MARAGLPVSFWLRMGHRVIDVATLLDGTESEDRFNAGGRPISISAGLDVSDKATHVCVVDAEGVVLRREVMASDPSVLAKWFGRYCLKAPRQTRRGVARRPAQGTLLLVSPHA